MKRTYAERHVLVTLPIAPVSSLGEDGIANLAPPGWTFPPFVPVIFVIQFFTISLNNDSYYNQVEPNSQSTSKTLPFALIINDSHSRLTVLSLYFLHRKVMDEREEKGLNLLALDGGGIRGLSTLFILKSIMISIQDEKKLPTEPLPCEVFDLIGGTSTGGLIALMLGRLRMSVDDAIQAYAKLSKKVFSQTKNGLAPDGRYKASNLEDAVKTIVKEYGDDSMAGIVDSRSGDGVCRTVVATDSAPRQLPIPCTIIEAARATTAAPTFFKRAVITVDEIKQTYMDGGLVQNNPCDVVLQEANLIFPDRQIAGILSIGTGQLPINKIVEPNFIKRLIPIDFAQALAENTKSYFYPPTHALLFFSTIHPLRTPFQYTHVTLPPALHIYHSF
ncbi:FabD/lysophospholipase-like protein [Stereum hirsutum FP-91666 SS1]|uniref:FabD/lysophospholipase-like protein n=1 Tax=Stereum hirsutum (strain FP-91666) TaxID=721885 RepID=R7RYZ6_STEHR|nr:FabD/lysophospholipase-like protein [Stereum hirsutum FP-91666 SS1]EIM79527.1 FabD/lysophospholipase-like protein [Stereum hirsutum FP-91666 SS1]